MQKCIDATAYRREIQLNYNKENGKEMKSTKGSSALSIFDLLKDQIEAEKPNEVVRSPPNDFHKGIELEPNHRIVSKDMIETDHLPSKPGVYMWKDEQGNILYIGKAKKLRNRVKSYLAQGAKHTPRIRTMLSKAQSVEFMLCPSDRDALVLENNMIKHHQPLYNVLLKDDDTYPSICATVGDPFPTFMIVPRRLEGERASKYKYFGPYPHYAEINRILQGIEEVYDLRSKSFQARFGDVSKADYQRLFQKALNEVFESKIGDSELATLRSNYEEASLLFGSEYNESTDIVAVGKSNDGGLAVVHVLQLRSGLIAGQFSYECQLGTGLILDDDFADAIQLVLEKRHYLSGGSPIKNGFSFFPDEILLQVELPEPGRLQDVLRSSQQVIEKPKKIKIRTPVTRGPRRQSDARCMQCAVENAIEVANQKALVNIENAPLSSVDGRAIKELAQMLSLENIPHKIECYDISHTQGVGTVGSRVVYVDGQPRRDLYRSFNVRSVDRPDDYASLEEVLERRFQHIWLGKDTGGALVDESDPWSIPDLIVIDGGKGQLSAAIKGMSKSNVLAETISLAVSDPVSLFDDNVCGGENDVEIVDGDFCVAEEEYQPRDGTFVRVPIVALAKKNEEVFVNGRSNPLIDVDSGSDSSALLLLRAIRDESHRFALTAHRRRRKKSMGL
jgi:excinuclease ABC subunit C